MDGWGACAAFPLVGRESGMLGEEEGEREREKAREREAAAAQTVIAGEGGAQMSRVHQDGSGGRGGVAGLIRRFVPRKKDTF